MFLYLLLPLNDQVNLYRLTDTQTLKSVGNDLYQ